MKDNEIIKGLECCANHSASANFRLTYQGQPLKLLLDNALDLINCQKAEIERLQNILLKFMDEVAKWEEKNGLDVSELPLIPICDKGRDAIDHHRAVAIKQFAERLKEMAWHGMWEATNHVDVDDIDYLVKEMVGEG